MRIVILSVFPPYRGGIAQFNDHMLRALRSEGHEVIPVNFSRQYPKFLFPGKSQFIQNFQSEEDIPATLDSIDPISWRKTARYINQIEADQVIIPFWTGYLAPALSAVAKKVNAPIIGLLHNAIPHDSSIAQRILSRRFFSNCDQFITLSKAVSRELLQLVPNAQITSAFHPIYEHMGLSLARNAASQLVGANPELTTLLFFGLIRPYKGLDILIKAFNELPDHYQLLIAGEAYEDKGNYERMISRSAVDRVIFSDGFIPDNEVNHWFSACDAVVLPYKSATQSGVTATAMHFNKPIIASNVGGLSEYIDDHSSGMLVRPNDPKQLEQAIIQWFDDYANTSHSSETVEQLIQKKKDQFSWKRFAQIISS